VSPDFENARYVLEAQRDGSTPMICTSGFMVFTASEIPAMSPPPDGDDNSIDVGRVFQNLQTNAPRASDDVEVVKAVDVLHALLGDELLRRDGGVRDAVAFQDDIGA
tara:strand:+ start:3311 stop:3631 length:321 start_codon:yes stop_codon:yes gene_type:complete